jgi:hypothetical protein
MPGLDKTGPTGAGPRTGRGLGCCANAQEQGAEKGGRPLGGGRGRCFGGGGNRGRRRSFSDPVPPSSSDDIDVLRAQLAAANEQIAALKARLDELEKLGHGQ